MSRPINLYTELRLAILAATLFFGGCDFLASDEDDEPLSSTEGTYILNEGVFGSTTASLWHLPATLDSATANVYRNLTGEPLGDTGQSLHLDGGTLYIIMGSSNTIEVLDLTGAAPVFVTSIDLPGASPREMVTVGNIGYVTSWGAPGVLVLDLGTYAIIDTIPIAGKPEDIVALDDFLYVSVPFDDDFSTNNRVHQIDPATGEISFTYPLASGPTQLLAQDGYLYVSRQWFDSTFTSKRGIGRIDPMTSEFTWLSWGEESGVDIFAFLGTIYVALAGGVAPIGADLSLLADQTLPASLANTYSAATDGKRIYIGSYSDFSSPGEVAVYDSTGALLKVITVGIGPGSFAFFTK